MKYTPQQQSVIDTRNANILVSAAAGSGKTAVLTERILQLISDKENPVDIDRLLIVTFTKAAAAEMRERIGREMKKRIEAHPEDANMQRQYTLLHNAQITTIDSFCLFVIRNNFSDIGLDPGFRTLEEGEKKLLYKEVLDELLEMHYEESHGQADSDFLHLVDCYAERGKDQALGKMILGLYEYSMSAPFPMQWLDKAEKDYKIETVEELKESLWWKKNCEGGDQLLEQLYQLTNEGIGILEGGELSAEVVSEDAYFLYFCRLKQIILSIRALETYEERQGKIMELALDFTAPRKKVDEVYQAIRKDCKAIREQIKKLIVKLQTKYYAASLEDILKEQQYIGRAAGMLLQLTREFAEALGEEKRNRNLLDFSDMEHLALNLLVEENPEKPGEMQPTRVALEYQNTFAHVMVDEYQDSNYVQEYILKSVCREDNYFMVGDVKQSIYRFRLARPDIFTNKYHRYAKDLEEASKVIDLNSNFRSRKEVIQSVNDVFERIMKKEVCGIAYDDNARLNPGAAYEESTSCSYSTEILLINKESAASSSTRAEEEGEEDAEESVQDLAVEEMEAWTIATRIRDLVKNKFLVTDKESGKLRPVEYRDIVILLRGISSFSDQIKKALEEEGIPVATTSKKGFYHTMEIQTLLMYLQVLDNPQQDIPLYGVLVSFFGGLTEAQMAQVRSKNTEASLYACITAYLEREDREEEIANKLSDFLKQLSAFRQRVPYTSLHELLLSILEETGFLAYITAFPGGQQRKANVRLLLEKTIGFEKTSYHGLFHFVLYMKQLKEQEMDCGEAGILDENSNVIRIMTIHKSKGLEFPVCFVSGLGKMMNKADLRASVLMDADLGIGLDYINPEEHIKYKSYKKELLKEVIQKETLAEEMRILYVAMTRAKEKLILTGVKKCEDGKAKAEEALTGREYLRELQKQQELTMVNALSAQSLLDFVLMGLPPKEYMSDFFQVVELEELKNDEIDQRMKQQNAKNSLLTESEKLEGKEALVAALERQFNSSYPHEALKGLYEKTSVSEIKRKHLEEMNEGNQELYPAMEAFTSSEEELLHAGCEEPLRASEVSKPDLNGAVPASQTLTAVREVNMGAKRGTAYHRIMELLPFEAFAEETDLDHQVASCIEKFVQEGRIEAEDAALVNKHKCKKFLESSLGRRMIAAAKRQKLYREKAFFLGIPAKELTPTFPEEENVLIQGVIDAYFEEEGEYILMDYKTDRVHNPEQLVEKYKVQLEIYQRALEQISGKKVKELILYSFSLNQEIKVF